MALKLSMMWILEIGLPKDLTLESISLQLRMVVTTRSKDLEMILPGASGHIAHLLNRTHYRIIQVFVKLEHKTVQSTVVSNSLSITPMEAVCQ